MCRIFFFANKRFFSEDHLFWRQVFSPPVFSPCFFPRRFFPARSFPRRAFPRRSFPRQVFSRQVFSPPVFPPPVFSLPKKHNMAGNYGMPLSANLLKLGSTILPQVKRASNRNKVATEKRSKLFFSFSERIFVYHYFWNKLYIFVQQPFIKREKLRAMKMLYFYFLLKAYARLHA